FFQAVDGIRDFHVTGVQTCALPISPDRRTPHPYPRGGVDAPHWLAVRETSAGEGQLPHDRRWAATRRATRRAGRGHVCAHLRGRLRPLAHRYWHAPVCDRRR